MSAPKHPALHSLAGNQAFAVAPTDTVWLSASAGTGKTQVLSARVLRLLLQPHVSPEQILCLTFTKAGATEMAARINETLARWVRADAGRLALELQAIGADIAPETQSRARTLFAAVLDCPGGGLRIDTIHAFSQWLLAAFPEEAGLSAGARPMEEHEKALLSRQVLADLLLDAEARCDEGLLSAVSALSLRMGPDAVTGWLMQCAGARDLWFGPDAWTPPLAGRVRQLLGLPSDADAGWVAAMCADDAFDRRSLAICSDAYRQWGTKTALAALEVIGAWTGADAGQRLAMLDDLWKVFFTAEGTLRSNERKAWDRIDPDAITCALRLGEAMAAIRAARNLLALAGWLTPALSLGRAYALAWDEAKAREGLIDFDDQIAHAADLLGKAHMADWIRYKLDRRFDHVLVDEAQDTNAAQWRIIEALTSEFFAGEGAHPTHAKDGAEIARTLFVVGDYKQAIFGFQGTSPENFETARKRVKARMGGAADNAARMAGAPLVHDLVELGLERSFRTAAPVLDFVDAAIAHVGPAAFGLGGLPEAHKGEGRPGYVVMWQPVGGKPDPDAEEADEGAEGWLSKPEREMADRIARQVKLWIDNGFPLVKGRKPGEMPRRATAGDVMVLVRKRRELAGLIVARLHAAGVPVAGVDRLRLGAPLAVRDLVAALRFAAQPLDDLNLASLLVSPLIGWTQAQLLAHGHRASKVHLWDHLRRSGAGDVAAARLLLDELLGRADFEPVQALLHWLLVGPWRARERLTSRLGREAGDPIDELVNAAHAFATTATPSLAGFIAWFEAGDGELKREAGGGGDMVRVMTVHGSKGLQAPIVILADATGDPAGGRPRGINLPDPMRAAFGGEARGVPLPPLAKDDQLGPIAEAMARAAKAEGEEHWRLLYVAMTRAEEALFIGGALGAREAMPAAGSWFGRLAELFDKAPWLADDIWGARAEIAPIPAMPAGHAQTLALPLDVARPGWLGRAPAEEPRPPRPLAPSALGEDDSATAPAMAGVPAADRAMAAKRGTLIHGLLERLPAVLPSARGEAAARWLARHAGDFAAEARAEMAQAALAVVCNPRWADLFAPDALAEVPIAAVVGDQVVAGVIDRLVVGPSRIRLVDFKTARRVPETADQVPMAILRQMAAYSAALEATYPGRVIEVAVLYTTAPRLIALSPEALAPHKINLGALQQSLGG